jgi:tripartite-type tricarboxylate transporter receptor subunit TctC
MKKIYFSLLVGIFFLPVHIFAADFGGKTVEWIIPFKEGGGSDKWSRFYAPWFSDNLPGSPNVVVKNVPGAGSTKGTNQFAQRSKADGLTILGTSGSTQFPYLLGDKRVKYEYNDWNLVLVSATGGVVYVRPELGVKSASDFKKLQNTKLSYGSQGATSLDLVPLLAFDLLGLNVRAIFGMKGRGDGRLAFERGETNIDYQTSSSYLSKVVPLAEAGEAIPLFSWGALGDDGKIGRDPTFPELPSFPEFYELAHGEKPKGPAFDAWKAFFVAGFSAQKMIFLPKGTPSDVIEAYRSAADAIVSDSSFPEKSKKRLGVYPQLTREAGEQARKVATQVPPLAEKWIKDWLERRFQVKL